MTVQAMGWILESSTSEGVARLCLLAMANHSNVNADGQEETWVSIGRVAREANCHHDTAKRTIAALHESGHITREIHGSPDIRIREDRRTNLYVLHLDNALIAELAAQRGAKKLPKRSGNTKSKPTRKSDRDLPSETTTGICDRNDGDLRSERRGSAVTIDRGERSLQTLREPLENPQGTAADEFSGPSDPCAEASPAALAAAAEVDAAHPPTQLPLPLGADDEGTDDPEDSERASAEPSGPDAAEVASSGRKPRERNPMFDAVKAHLAGTDDTGAFINQLAELLKAKGYTPTAVQVLAGLVEEANPLGRTIGNAKKLAKSPRTLGRCEQLSPHIATATEVVARIRADFEAGKLSMGSHADYATAVAVAERLSLGNDATAIETVLRKSTVWTANAIGVELGRHERSQQPMVNRFDPSVGRARPASADDYLARVRADRKAVQEERERNGGQLPESARELLARVRRGAEGAA